MTSASGGRRSIQLSYGREAVKSRLGPAMDLSVVFLGTGGSVPSARRATACVLLRAGGCARAGRLRRGRPAPDDQLDRARPGRRHLHHPLPRGPLPRPARAAQDVRPAGASGAPADRRPRGPARALRALRRIFGRLRYEVELVELAAGGGDRARRIRDARLRRRAPDEGARLRVRRAGAAGPLRRRCRPRARHRRRPRLRPAAAWRDDRGGRLRGPAGAGDGRAARRAQGRRSPATPPPAR